MADPPPTLSIEEDIPVKEVAEVPPTTVVAENETDTKVHPIEVSLPKIQTAVYKKVGYKEVDATLTDAFNFANTNNSMICDIVATYLKGQKILYTEAKTVCEQRLNYLMLPAIAITAICTILSLVLKDQENGATIVASLNGANAFLLALINYLKLDAKAEAHRTSAYKFDKLQSYVEFNSGKILFTTDAADDGLKQIKTILDKTETDVREIKETNQFILPEKIRYNFPSLSNFNVFAQVKHIQTKEVQQTNYIKDIMNEINELKTAGNDVKEKETKLKWEISKLIGIKDEYISIDKSFERELARQRNKLINRFNPCGWLKT